MRKVKIISPISLDIYKITTDKPINVPVATGCMGCLSKIGLLLFPVITLFLGILFLSVGIAPDDGSGTILWLCFISIFVVAGGFLWLRWIVTGGNYKPGKSFYWWRLTKEKMQLIYKVVVIVVVLISIPLLIVQFKLVVLLSLIGALGGLYVISNSFDVHENIDYVANQELTDIIGMEVGEKVQASYLKKKVILLLTDKKVICAHFDSNQWKIINKKIEEITKIGIYTPVMMGGFFNTELYFILIFTDSTRVELKMDLGDNTTSNPDLFFRKFLVVLDSVLLGKVDEKIVSRRRVSVNTNNQPPLDSSIIKESNRKINISNKVVPILRSANPEESGRVIEL